MLRARHLLDLRGIDVARQGEAASQAFLSAQFEWRAALGEARASRDEEALRALEVSAREQADALTANSQTNWTRHEMTRAPWQPCCS
jgi:molecular chaperone HscB